MSAASSIRTSTVKKKRLYDDNIPFAVVLSAGQCKSRFTSRKVPYCVRFHPDDDKQHLFVAGTSDKKIVCVSLKRNI